MKLRLLSLGTDDQAGIGTQLQDMFDPLSRQ